MSSVLKCSDKSSKTHERLSTPLELERERERETKRERQNLL